MRILPIVIALVLAGCSTRPEPLSGEAAALRFELFGSGTFLLECGTGCAFQFGGNRTRLKQLHDQEQWGELATSIMSIGYDQDLAWYYLARAAEGLGHLEAAGIYYSIARVRAMKCSAFWDSCDGINIQKDTAERIKALSAAKASTSGKKSVGGVRGFKKTGSAEPVESKRVKAAQSDENKGSVSASKSLVGEPEPLKPANWHLHSSRIVAVANVEIPWQEEAASLALSFDGQHVRLSGLYSREYYLRSFTSSPPVFANIGGKPYVAYPWFFEQEVIATISLGDLKIDLVWDGAPHWAASPADTSELVKALGRQPLAEAVFSVASPIGARVLTVKLDLAGFEQARRDLEASIAAQSSSLAAQDPFDSVVSHLAGNHFDISQGDLTRRSNPAGEGYFVYVPETRFDGTERLFIWFVNNGVAIKLNGATDNLTPELPFPREAEYKVWQGTGLTHENVVSLGLKTAFER